MTPGHERALRLVGRSLAPGTLLIKRSDDWNHRSRRDSPACTGLGPSRSPLRRDGKADFSPTSPPIPAKPLRVKRGRPGKCRQTWPDGGRSVAVLLRCCVDARASIERSARRRRRRALPNHHRHSELRDSALLAEIKLFPCSKYSPRHGPIRCPRSRVRGSAQPARLDLRSPLAVCEPRRQVLASAVGTAASRRGAWLTPIRRRSAPTSRNFLRRRSPSWAIGFGIWWMERSRCPALISAQSSASGRSS